MSHNTAADCPSLADAAAAKNPSTETALSKPTSQAPPRHGTVSSTQPVPTVYPHRRPNIFRARQKHLRYLDAAYAPAKAADTHELEIADGFESPAMEQFQAEVKKTMEKKTAAFTSKVSQHNWSQRRVEDLGEIFALED